MEKDLVRRLALCGIKSRGYEQYSENGLYFHPQPGIGIKIYNYGLTAKIINGYENEEDFTVFSGRALNIGESINVMLNCLEQDKEKTAGNVIFKGGIVKCGSPGQYYRKEDCSKVLGGIVYNGKDLNIESNTESDGYALPVMDGTVLSIIWKEDGDIYYGYNGVELDKICDTKDQNIFAYFVLSSHVKEITIV